MPWLREVPEHWEVQRGKWLFRHKKQINVDRSNSNILSLTLRGVVNNDPENPEGLVPKDYASYQLFRKGDLVFKLIDLENLRTSRVGLVHEDGIMSPAYVRLIPQLENNIYFFFQQYFDLYQRGIYNQLGAGVRSTLGPNDLLDLNVLVPSLPEQSAIVHYLDHIDRRIRRYIRTKQKLIKLLEEQKKAIIHQAVTRGLDPDVKLKPSGVEWLGNVPENWEVKRLKTLVRAVTSGSRGWSDYASDYGPMFIRIGNLTRNSIELDFSDVIRLNLPRSVEGEATRTKVETDDLLLSITAFIGSVAVVPSDIGEAYVSQHVARCALKPGVANPRWIAYVLFSPIGQSHGQLSMYGGTKQGLSLDDVKNYLIVLPPRKEQDLLVQRIEAETQKVIFTIDRTNREISLLREYRTRLIADVVTGKLDVREATVNLLEETEEMQVEEDFKEETTEEELEEVIIEDND